ncbi:DUF1648 domain-containing protein [Hanstruepera flava]|uniref:DUF1648 domain-containing protein n=1 Tax=Hanstruepera flava TaxID=2930218 RepID=UPI002028602E|nr:DUF1648 domain-containing protein [Hanstruepera flava]
MRNTRPRIKVPFEGIDIFLELVSITLLLLIWIYVFIEYNNLPETIASHFNAKGEADGYSNKLYLWFIPVLATTLYVGLFVLNKYPHVHNYIVNITEENALKNYRFSTRVVRVVNTLTVIMFAYIIYYIVQSAKDNEIHLSNWFVPVVVGFSLLLPIVILLYYKKLNKS